MRARLPHRMRIVCQGNNSVSVKKQLPKAPAILNGQMTPKNMRSRLRNSHGAGGGKSNARGSQLFPERLMERDATIWPSKWDVATDTAAGDAERVATMIATTSPKRGECAGDTGQILRNASMISVTEVGKDANAMQQKEGCVMCIQERLRRGLLEAQGKATLPNSIIVANPLL